MHKTHDTKTKAANQGDNEYVNDHDTPPMSSSNEDDEYANDHDITPMSSSNKQKAECTTFESHDGTSSEDAVPDGSEPIMIIENDLEAELNKAPDGGWGWFVVLAAMLTHVLMGGFERANGIFYLQFREKFHSNATTTAWVLSMFSTFRLVGVWTLRLKSHQMVLRIIGFDGVSPELKVPISELLMECDNCHTLIRRGGKYLSFVENPDWDWAGVDTSMMKGSTVVIPWSRVLQGVVQRAQGSCRG